MNYKIRSYFFRLKREMFISPARRRLVENTPLYFPFGGKQTRNILRDFKGSHSQQIQVNWIQFQ